ncbi:MAG: hypothetical protein JST11_01405 [Acidobacteria bacterium]|nr:hypothetical protein [Acidobacteriota bacterium]
MSRFTLLVVLATAAWAQGGNPLDRPPADVDRALRARITEFFQFHVTGEYRKAEELVAEDTKDYFYDHNKPRYLSFEIRDIEYSDHFTRAKAVVLCEQRINAIGFGTQPFKVPTPSTWKLEDGKWYWWVDPKLRNLTPFGNMQGGPASATGGAPAMPAIPSSADFLFQQVKLDKDSLSLPRLKTGEVTLTNSAPGTMKLTVSHTPPGIEAVLSKSELGSGEKATLNVTAGSGAKPGDVELQVYPTGQILKVGISVK